MRSCELRTVLRVSAIALLIVPVPCSLSCAAATREARRTFEFDRLPLGFSYADETIRAPECAFDEPFFKHLSSATLDYLESASDAHGILLRPLGESALSELISGSVREIGRDLGGFCFPERNAGGVAVGDYDGDGHVDIYLTRLRRPGVLLRNTGPPNFRFQDRTSVSKLDTSCQSGGNGAVWFDIDNDGDLDLYVSTVGSSRHCLWINQGDGTFSEEAERRNAGCVLRDDPALTSGGSIAVVDFDADGFLDLYVTEWRFHFLADAEFARSTGRRSNSRLLRNRGLERPGHFEDVTTRAGLDLDAAVSERLETHRRITNRLARRANQHAKRRGAALPTSLTARRRKRASMNVPMVDVVPDGVFTFAPVWADFDDDGYPDLFVAGDFKTSMMFWNNGNGTFTEGTAQSKLGLDENGMGVAVGDFDGDLRPDIFVSAIFADHASGPSRDPTSPFGSRGNVLYRNLGNRTFGEVTLETGVEDGGWGWGATWIDADNDGILELFLTNGFRVPETSYDDLFWNVNSNRFWVQSSEGARWTDFASEAGLASTEEGRGVVTLDFDEDGRQDLLVVNHVGSAALYRNVGAGSRAFLRVRVRECANCRDSYGALVYVAATREGKILFRRMSIVGSAGGFLGQSEMIAHFGFGDVETDCERPETECVLNVTVCWANDAGGNRVTRTYVAEARRLWSRTIEVAKDSPSMNILERSRFLLEDDVDRTTSFDRSASSTSSLRPSEASDIFCLERAKTLDGVLRAVAEDAVRLLRLRTVENDAEMRSNGHAREYRTVDGSTNNRKYALRGASFTPFLRHFPAAYADGSSAPSGEDRPSARVLSDTLFKRSRRKHDRECDANTSVPRPVARMNELALHFGQLLAHDITHSTPQPNVSPVENFPIFMDDGRKRDVMRFRRTTYTTSEAARILFGDDEANSDGDASSSRVREQINKVTSFVDASVVYGAEDARSGALRLGRLGLMRSSFPTDATSSREEYPPVNGEASGVRVPNDDPLGRGEAALFACGDVRANIQPGLLALHTLWLREHNFIATQFVRALTDVVAESAKTEWCEAVDDAEAFLANSLNLSVHALDAFVFEESRRILIAEFQIVAYREYLPTLFGVHAKSGSDSNAYDVSRTAAYDEDVHPSVSNAVATSALRFGHAHVVETLARILPDGSAEELRLRDAYFMNVSDVVSSTKGGGVDAFLRAYLDHGRSTGVGDDVLCERAEEDADRELPPCVADAVREFLFGADQRRVHDAARSGAKSGMDLIAINIQRGRDHGLPDYSTLRSLVGLSPVDRVADFPSASKEHVSLLRRAYGEDASNIDAFVGLALESKEDGKFVGPLTERMLMEQFNRLRDGDRFYYERHFPREIIDMLHAVSGMHQILMRNTVALAPHEQEGGVAKDACSSIFLECIK